MQTISGAISKAGPSVISGNDVLDDERVPLGAIVISMKFVNREWDFPILAS